MKTPDLENDSCIVRCDYCNKGRRYNTCKFVDINKDLKNNKWSIKKVNNLWCDFCSEECENNYIKRIANILTREMNKRMKEMS